MDTKTGLDVLECEIAQIEATVFMLKWCLRDFRYSIVSRDDKWMRTNKTLFTALEAELRNARAALNNAGAHVDMIKNVKDSMGADVMGKTESENYEKLIAASKKLKEHSKLL